MSLLSLKAWPENSQRTGFLEMPAPAVPGIIEAFPAKCAVLLHLEPATTWVCEGAKM